MTIASLLSAACMGMGFLVFTRSTLTPFDNIGVMTMKMMSITSITSTMGVTLISETGGKAFALSFAVPLVTNADCCFIISPSREFGGNGRPGAGAPSVQLAGFLKPYDRKR